MASTAQFKTFGPYYRNGELVTAPRLYHYAAGTSTLKNAYTDRTKVTTAAQPILGNANGIIEGFFDGVYKIEVRLSDNATVFDIWDNVDITEGIHTLRGTALVAEISVADNVLYTSPLIPLAGCVLGNFVLASQAGASLNGLMVNAYVSTTGNVQFTVFNKTGGLLVIPEQSWSFLIFQT